MKYWNETTVHSANPVSDDPDVQLIQKYCVWRLQYILLCNHSVFAIWEITYIEEG